MYGPSRGSRWVRYLGSSIVHQAETFPIPTDEIPVRVARLFRNRDVAQVWYLATDGEWDYRLAQEHKK